MKICWQTILMKYHTLFFSQKLSSAAVVIGALKANRSISSQSLLTWIKMKININKILVPECYFQLVFFVIVFQGCHPLRLSKSRQIHQHYTRVDAYKI